MEYGNAEVFLSPEEREGLIRRYLGKTVDVVIDRPIGYHHVTKGVHLDYTVNYGYIPGVMGGDGEEQDVYVLGVDKPIERFRGPIIGVIRRSDDNEDKFVAAPEGMAFHQAEIARQVHFVEQYFDSKVRSIYPKSCGVIPYRIRRGKPEYLLGLQSHSRCWSVPKGHMELGESEQETALRELWEETGITANLHNDFREVFTYRISPIARKELVLFLGEAEGEPVFDEREILELRWMPLEEAKPHLLPDAAAVMEKAEAYLRK